MTTIKPLASLILTGCLLSSALADDWPQWRGPNRDGVSTEKGLNLDWTANKPPLLWAFKQAGAGYSTPSIVGATLYCAGAAEGSDFAFALNTETGEVKWKQKLGAQFVQDRGDGPRGAITVDGDRLYLVRGSGELHCLSAADGSEVWKKDLRKDLGGNIMSRWDWGFSESPLVDGELVICTPGGDGGTMAALNKKTGEVVWRSTEWTATSGYPSPIVAEVNGVRQYIQFGSDGVAGVAAKDGKLLWKAAIANNRIAIIPTPIYHDNLVYVTSGYRAGCGAVRLVRDGQTFRTEPVYSNAVMANHHGGVVRVGDYLYGHSDNFPSAWVCQNLQTGEKVWEATRADGIPGKGSVTCVDGRLLCLDEDTGALTVASASPEGWKSFGRLDLPERTTIQTMDNKVWTHPVVANGKLYLRHHDLLFCYDIKAR